MRGLPGLGGAAPFGLVAPKASSNLRLGATRPIEPALWHPGLNESGRGCHRPKLDPLRPGQPVHALRPGRPLGP